VAPSLTRSRVCIFQFLPGIASAACLRAESHGTHDHILLSLFLRLPQPGGSGSCIYIAQEQDSPIIPSGIGFKANSQSQNQSSITTDSLSASPSWYQAPTWDPRPIFPIPSLIIFWQFRVCWRGASSLTRSRVCTFQFLSGITSAAFLRSESHGIHEHSSLSLFFRLPQPGGPVYLINGIV
jgi:hypothetical protein